MFLDSVIDTAWDTYKLWKTSKNLVHNDVLHIQTVQHARAMSKSQAIPSFFYASTQKWKKKSFYQENKYKSTEKPIQLLFRILMSFIIIILVFSLYCSKK